MTVVAVTLCTVVPGAMFAPETGIPVPIPLVPPEPKVSVTPGRQSAVVVAVRGANVMTEPVGTSAGTPALRVTVVPVTLCTVVPAAMFGPATAIPAVIPSVPPGSKVSTAVSCGQSAVVVTMTGST